MDASSLKQPVFTNKKYSSLASRLAEARRRLFVGRQSEKNLFRNLLDPDGDLRVLYIDGAGGLGKSTLLREYASLAGESGYPVIQLDARSIAAMPDALAQAIDQARNTSKIGEDAAHVILLDTFELLTPLEVWLREQWLPQQSDEMRMVIAGRTPPSTAWRTDPAWATGLQCHKLDYLNEEQTRDYLTRRNLPTTMVEQGTDFARGHPLALALFAETVSRGPDNPLAANTASNALLPELTASLLDHIEDEAQRNALYACAIVRSMSEPLLSGMLPQNNCRPLFTWLHNLSFIETGPNGLFPHDLIREALVADIKQRNPDLYHQLGERAYTWLIERMESGKGDAMGYGLDTLFLLRDMDVPWHIPTPSNEELAYVDRARKRDMLQIEAMLARHEGASEVPILQAFVSAQPEALRVIRDNNQQVLGFYLLLALHKLPSEVIKIDPVSTAFMAHCRTISDNPGRISLLRFWMHRDQHMALSNILTLVFVPLLLDMAPPGQAFSGIHQLDDPVWKYVGEMFGNQRLAGSERTLPAGPTAIAFQDYTQRRALDWLRSIYRRVQSLLTGRVYVEPEPEAAPTLDKARFEQGVRDALKQYHRPHRLDGNPLLGSQVVIRRAGNTDRAACLTALRALIQEIQEELSANPRTEPMGRALRRGYLVPAPSQRLAAEAAHMAYGSFRRHLAEAVKLVQTRLWLAEKEAQKSVS